MNLLQRIVPFFIGAIAILSCGGLQNENKVAIERITKSLGDISRPEFSPDGKNLLFYSTVDGPNNIYLFSLSDKASVKIASDKGRNSFAKWSPDGRSISYTKTSEGKQEVMLYDLSAQQTKSVLEGGYANWSPDGRFLVYEKPEEGQGTNLWIWDFQNESSIQLTDFEGNENNFGWSYDGQWIGYNSRGTNVQHLFAINLATRDVRQLVGNRDGKEWHPRWSKKENKVLFYSTWDQEMTDIWITSLSDQRLDRITKDPVEEFGPVWNMDETLVAFFSHKIGANDVHIYDVKGKTEYGLGLSKRVAEVIWTPLSWSPTQNMLAVIANDQQDHVYELEIESKDIRQVTHEAHGTYHPSYDKSGRYLLYYGGATSNEIRIWDTENDQIASIPPQEDYHFNTNPRWSPNEQTIGFVNGIGGAMDTNDFWISNIDGTNQQKITHSGGVRNIVWINDDEVIYAVDSSTKYIHDIWKVSIKTGLATTLLSHSANAQPTSLSPDGKSFLFFGDFDGKDKIYSMPVSGGSYSEIPNELDHGRWPVYSPDGKYIAFISNQNQELTDDIYVMASEGGAVTRLTNDVADEYDLSWSKWNNKILFNANYGNQDLWLVNVDNTLNKK